MTEWFVLVVGIIEKLVTTDSNRSSSVQTNIEAPAIVYMPTGTDHTFDLGLGAIMLTLSDQPFNEAYIISASEEYMAVVEQSAT